MKTLLILLLLVPSLSLGLTFKSDGSIVDSKGNIIKTEKDLKIDNKKQNKIYFPFNSEYIKGVTNKQWEIISKIGDPLDCKKRIERIENSLPDIIISPEEFENNPKIINDSLKENFVVKLKSGKYMLDNLIIVPKGKILLGEDYTEIISSNVYVTIANMGSISNLKISNPKSNGVMLASNSDTHMVIVEKAGIDSKDNSSGNGISSRGKSSHDNCVVSVEASFGYNEKGNSKVTEKGGNADGFAVKQGAYNITLIDTHAHHNSDDGFDFWKGGWNAEIKNDSPTIRVFYSSANHNGKNPYTQNGDGNGFKLGSSNEYQYPKEDKGARLIYGSVACFNKDIGFTRNKSPSLIFAYNLESKGNKKDYLKIGKIRNNDDDFILRCKMF